ncbi:MAG: LysR substrate-binding domain-containing protein [Pseudomonadota bacterium]
MPTLQQLRYLVAISETLHFRRAAESVHVTQPTLSGQLRELEDKLGVQLVERSRAKVILTPVGKSIAARARTVLRDVQDIVDLAKHGQSVLGGTVRLGVLESLGPYLLPHILPELHRTYPNLKLYVREGVPRTLLVGLDEGALDLLLFPLPVKGADLMSARLFREPLWIVAPGNHPLRETKHVSRADLKGETILALEQGHRLHDQVRDLCDQFGANLSLDYEGTSLETLRQMVGMGMGLSFLPALYVRAGVGQDDEIVAREMKTRPPSRVIGMIWRRRSARQDEFLALADLIRNILRKRTPEVTVMS